MAFASGQLGALPANGFAKQEQRRIAEQERAQQARQMQSLTLQRELILSQRTSSPVRRSALEAALKQVDEQIASLN